MDTVTITIPQRFFDDHHYRDCIRDDFDLVAKRGKYTVTLTISDFADLIDDAVHYADEPQYGIGMNTSARATINAVKKQMTYGQLSTTMQAAGYPTTIKHIKPY